MLHQFFFQYKCCRGGHTDLPPLPRINYFQKAQSYSHKDTVKNVRNTDISKNTKIIFFR